MRDGSIDKTCGFTLIELLISMAVGLMVLGALVSTFVIQRKSYDVQEQVTEMIQIGRAAMDMIGREIRMAGYNPAGASFNGITYDAAHLQILADLDGDGTTTGSNENITYTYDAGNLQIVRNTGGGAQPFAENIQSFTFEYVDGSGSATTTTADIRQIRITIVVRVAKPDPNYGINGGYRTNTLTSGVTPKNIAL